MAIADPPIPTPPPPSPPPPSIMPMLYYSLIVIATVAGLLAVYNLIIIKCGDAYSTSPAADSISRTPTAGSISSFKYKDDGEGDGGGASIDTECAVCLSVFEEGEELKQLPNCKHRFHAPCIDMWLYSHTSCPLCRTTVAVAHPREEALLGPAVLV